MDRLSHACVCVSMCVCVLCVCVCVRARVCNINVYDITGKSVHISLCANPSHLEAVNPIVNGKTRAKQHFSGDTQRKRCLPVILHGDAAFAGQGVVYETLELSDIKGYTTGGSIHIIANNQIGFTTDPRFSRSTPHCTDVAKSVGAPIFHINGDDPEAVCWAMETAVEYRQVYSSN
jgi:2-oxoglutarate dehydrogenase E1 component